MNKYEHKRIILEGLIRIFNKHPNIRASISKYSGDDITLGLIKVGRHPGNLTILDDGTAKWCGYLIEKYNIYSPTFCKDIIELILYCRHKDTICTNNCKFKGQHAKHV